MIFRVILCCLIYISPAISYIEDDKKSWNNKVSEARCLTGYMTDIQPWVDEFGYLTNWGNIGSSSIVVSNIKIDAVKTLELEMTQFQYSTDNRIQFLSMAKCMLMRVPPVFKLKDRRGRSLANTVEYVTFYGNYFGSIESSDDVYDVTLNATQVTHVNTDFNSLRKQLTLWAVGFQSITFKNLKELDLRSCSIEAVGDHTFQRMPRLKRLYLGENKIHYIEANAFTSLTNLKHLDLSQNHAADDDGPIRNFNLESIHIFRNTPLEFLDLSFTNIGIRNMAVLKNLERSLKTLSICNTGITNTRKDVFRFRSLKFLDISGNNDILCSPNMFQGLNETLQVLYAENIGLRDMEPFDSYTKLEILKLNKNELTFLSKSITTSLKNLQILDLDDNRIISTTKDTFSRMPNLKMVSLKNNYINVITMDMYNDFENLSYISLSGNILVCNCYARDIYQTSLKNELIRAPELITELNTNKASDVTFHIGFQDYNNLILGKLNISSFCENSNKCDIELNDGINGKFFLLDYNEYISSYDCLIVSNETTIPVFKFASCTQEKRDIDHFESWNSWRRFLLFIIPGFLLPVLFLFFVFRKNLRYFIITVKNSATLSLISQKDIPEEGSIFNYDVFVSYCNEDRDWVLDQLLPHVERDCNISVCLHERDFQVGLSILENIVSCMDRSRSIMLIISKRFLLSQWCQFEMHLAQHRLLETRREDLILILLEEIPRRLRPNTLHYLMLTKTYIVWPKEQSEQNLFWKRMKKSLVTHKLKHQESISLA